MLGSVNFAGYGRNSVQVSRPLQKQTLTFAGHTALEPVTLRNGSKEAKALVVATVMSLEELWSQGVGGILAVYDLVQRAKDPSYEFFGSNKQKLIDRALVQPNGSIHDSIRNIVLSSVEGEELDMKLVNPIQK